MRLLGRLLRRKAGRTPLRPSLLVAIGDEDVLDEHSWRVLHNEAVRTIRSLQVRAENLELQSRAQLDRIEALEGGPRTAKGDPQLAALQRRVLVLEQTNGH